MIITEFTKLLKFYTIWIITLVLISGIVALFAFGAS